MAGITIPKGTCLSAPRPHPDPIWPTLAVVTALGAILGDLVFSAIKRRAGIKDFAVALPGHGGILDRFDSLIVAAPVYAWTRLLLSP